jgi:cellulose synthase/poly-beta-1,6-N-acetylglucosamine synthase-like glycosyltransferase
MVWWYIAGACALLSLHPFVTYPLSLFVGAKLRPASRDIEPSIHPARIAVLFCAYNEESVIEDKLHNCIGLCEGDPNAGVYVYTDGCSDRTVDIVRRFGERVYLIEGKSRRGKSVGMNELARIAQQEGADILFFTDANVLLDANALSAMRAEFTDRSVGCVTGHLDYINPDESATASVGTHYWSLDSMIKQLETGSGSCIGADGSIFAIRAELFRPVPENIIDDFFTSMSVLCDGWRCVYSHNVVARERAATLSGEEYRRKVRIACRAFNCHRLLWPRLKKLSSWNIYKYISHKLIRWLTIFWAAGALIAIAAGIATMPVSWTHKGGILLGVIVFAGAVWLLPGPPWRHMKEAVIAIMATGLGVLKSIRGERFQTWSQAPTTRQAVAKPKAEV